MLITIVKITSLIVGAAFAVLGTTVDYKKEGQVTKWGRIAIIGVILSSLLSAILLAAEESNKRDAEIKANTAQEELNNQFRGLVERSERNIKTTEDNIRRTEDVAKNVEGSILEQRNLIAQTNKISNGVEANIQGQKQLIDQSKEIAGTLNSSVMQQTSILTRFTEQVALQKTTFEKTREIQKQNNEVMANTLRSLNPLRPLAITYTLKFSLEDPRIKTYANALIQLVKSSQRPDRLSDNDKYFTPVENINDSLVYVIWKNKLQPEQIDVIEMSTCFPSNEKISECFPPLSFEQIQMAENLIDSASTLSLNFYKNLQHPNEDSIPDLLISMSANPTMAFDRGDGFKPNTGRRLLVDLRQDSKGFYVTISTNYMNVFAQNSDKILAFSDVPDSLLTISSAAEIQNIVFFTGDNYSRSYYPEGKFSKAKCTYENNYSSCTSEIQIKKLKFGIPTK